MVIDIDAVIADLWPRGDSLNGEQVHLLADGARDDALAATVRFGKLDYLCLFGEPLTPELRAAAPYLIHLSAASPQTRRMLQRALEVGHAGILVSTPASVTTEQLRRHFKKLLWVQDESERRLYFRFYDPRVLAIYLPACTQEERRDFFGPVTRLIWLNDEGAARPVTPLAAASVA